jgi:phage baseplate assembly protein W
MSRATRRAFAELTRLHQRLGRDLLLTWAGPSGGFTDGDLATSRRPGPPGVLLDLAVASEVPQAAQFLVNRLMTRRGELAALGHPDYGSRHHELIGEPNNERTRNLVKLYILDALRQEPRVAKVLSCSVTSRPYERDMVRVLLQIRLIEQDEPLNLVVPFDVGGGAS